MEKFIIYQVLTNLNGIREVECIRKTETSYWVDGISHSNRLETEWYKSFYTKDEAVKHMRYLLQFKISHLKSSAEHYEEQLKEFNLLNP